ncbi:MAG: MarR family transcriptional regulator [Rhizobiaceae bacterium]
MRKIPSNDTFNLEEFLPFCLHQASETVSQSFRTIYRSDYGMTRTEWRVFAQLGQYGAMTATQVGSSANLHKTKVSRAVFTLEKRRWLKRQPDTDDRRNQIIALTTEGKRAFRELGQRGLTYNQRMRELLGKDRFDEVLRLTRELEEAVAKL